MKIFTLSLLFLFVSVESRAQMDTIPNAGFERWTYDTIYSDPNNWACENPLTAVINVFTCLQDSTSPHSGRYCAKLVSQYISAVSKTEPGILTTGVIDVASQSVISGIFIASRPQFFTGWYQFVPAGLDTGLIEIKLFNGDSLIGLGALHLTDTANTWTYFNIPVIYNSGMNPDTVQLYIVSSGGVAPIQNTTLLLDDLNYSYIGGIAETQVSPINIYPNPAGKQLNIDNQAMLAASLKLYSAYGQLVQSIKMHEGNNVVDVSALPAGVYLLSGTGADGGAYSSSVVIDK